MAKELVNAETDLTKPKQTRTPKKYGLVEKAALSLELKDRVELRNRLTLSIEGELKELEEKFNKAKALVG